MQNEISAQLLKTVSPYRKPEVLYHYTSGAGLLGILNSQSIWATNIRFLNDSTEYSLALAQIRSLVLRRLEKAKNSFDRGLYAVLEEKLNKAPTEVYVSSFTVNPDQLSQWRAYCPLNGGYAIGFRRKSLLSSGRPGSSRFFARCIYDETDQSNLINELVACVAEFALQRVSDKLDHDRIYRESFKMFGHLIPFVAPALKHPSFEEEREWRLVSFPDSFEASPLRFHEGRSMLVPHYEHCFRGKADLDAIEELVVGPTPHPRLATEAAEALLLSIGFTSTKVRSSSIPYRSW